MILLKQKEGLIMSDKPNCYKCKYRGTVPGNAHSSCNYPGTDTGILSMFEPVNQEVANKLHIEADFHGIRSGWFMWPVDFDPVWLERCDGFEEKKEDKENE